MPTLAVESVSERSKDFLFLPLFRNFRYFQVIHISVTSVISVL